MEHIAVRALLFNKGKVLMVREKDEKHWSFPGGGIKEGENVIDALQREVKEEISLEIRGSKEYCRYTHNWWKEGETCTDIFFITEGDISQIKKDGEIGEYAWFDYGFQKYNFPMHEKYIDRSIWERMFNDKLIQTPFSISNKDIDTILDICKGASRIIMDYYEKGCDIEQKQLKDKNVAVTIADREADEYICKRLRVNYSNFGIVSEEKNNEWKEDFVWCVDPLDGTNGFVTHNGCFQILIGLMYYTKPIWGFIYDPVQENIYTGGIGRNAFLISKNKKEPLVVQQDSARGNILVISKDKNKDSMKEHFPNISFEKIFGHDSKEYTHRHMFMHIAMNEANLRIEERTGVFGVWDMCATEAILTSAGGFVSDLELNPLKYYIGEKFLRTGFIASDTKERAANISKIL